MVDWSPPGSPSNISVIVQEPQQKKDDEDQTTHATGSLSADSQTTNLTTYSAGPSVHITSAFQPSEVDDASGRMTPEMCLTLDGGEIVKVMAAGAGWLYGCVADKPE